MTITVSEVASPFAKPISMPVRKYRPAKWDVFTTLMELFERSMYDVSSGNDVGMLLRERELQLTTVPVTVACKPMSGSIRMVSFTTALQVHTVQASDALEPVDMVRACRRDPLG